MFGLMSFEFYHSVFITQNSKIVGPTQSMLFGLVFELSFHNSKLKKKKKKRVRMMRIENKFYECPNSEN